jgi:hypothetical protein
MSRVFQNIDPYPPLRLASVYPPAFVGEGGGGHTRRAERGVGPGGSIFWKTRGIGLPSYSNNLSTDSSKIQHGKNKLRIFQREKTHLEKSLIFVIILFRLCRRE